MHMILAMTDICIRDGGGIMTKFGNRVWEISAIESKFESKLVAEGFHIDGIKEYKTGFTDYHISKDGVDIVHRLYRDSSSNISSIMCTVVDNWKLKCALLELADRVL